MQKLLIIAGIMMLAPPASAQYFGQQRDSGYGSGTGSNPSSHYVQPYMNQNGSYVGGHQQTNPNNTQLDNFGTRGNYNPYTGNNGTRNPYR